MWSRAGISRTTSILIVVLVIVVVVLGGLLAYYATRVPPPPPKEVLFYTWWATTGKVAGEHTWPLFTQYFHIPVKPYIVPGAGGTAAKYAIIALIEAGKPPTTFQSHEGPEMISYIEITPQGASSFYNATAWWDSLLSTGNVSIPVIEAGMFNGHMYLFPVNVHRGGLLFFNPQVLREYNLPIPTTLDQLYYDAYVLYQHGICFMIPGGDSGWDQFNLWENIFLALGGPKLYMEFLYGTLNLSDPHVQAIINETNTWFLKFQALDCPGWESMTWTQGAAWIVEGKASFQTNGDWWVTYTYDFLNTPTYPAIPPYTSWTNITAMAEPFPGTAGVYPLVVDSVAVPVGPGESYGVLFAEWWSSWYWGSGILGGESTWTKWKAVTFYTNITTDYFNTPEQWWSYEELVNWSKTPSDWCRFVYQLSDGGVFDDVFAQVDQGLLTYAEVGPSGTSQWMQTLASALAEEKAEWLKANQLGLGYLGWPGYYLGCYEPPWVSGSG